MILVAGATGNVGGKVVAALLRRGASIRALTRRPQSADLPGEVEVVGGDLDDPSSLPAAMPGVDRVFMLSDGTRLGQRDANLAAASADAGLRQIVKLSVLSASHAATDPITQWHLAGEQAVRDSGVPWTFLRANGFMSNALNWAPSIAAEHAVYAPYAAGRTSLIDPADIAAVAAVALTEGGHSGRSYDLTGPEALSPSEQVEILGGSLDLGLSYVEDSPEHVRRQMESHGMPPVLADAVLQSMAGSLMAFNAGVSPDLERVVGRPAHSFREWADAHRTAFLTGSRDWTAP
jgi:(4-alkanoyl-5-oxo-2,5-dihydrofuran-3-yl)methyl phosphate reductase